MSFHDKIVTHTKRVNQGLFPKQSSPDLVNPLFKELMTVPDESLPDNEVTTDEPPVGPFQQLKPAVEI